MNRKRQIIINAVLANLHDEYWDYIERAVGQSQMNEARLVIAYIKEKL